MLHTTPKGANLISKLRFVAKKTEVSMPHKIEKVVSKKWQRLKNPNKNQIINNQTQCFEFSA